MRWTDLRSQAALIRDPKGGPARSINLSLLLMQELMPLIQQKVRAARPFGKSSPTAPTISQLLNSLLVRARLTQYSLDDFVRWSLAQTDAIRASVVTA